MRATQLPFVPSQRTIVHLGVSWLVAAGVCAWFFAPKLFCAAKPSSCEELFFLALFSLAYGLAFAALYVSLAVLLDLVVQRIQPQAPSLEPIAKVLPVVATLFVIQVAVLGLMAVMGALPASWPWWLGTLGSLHS